MIGMVNVSGSRLSYQLVCQVRPDNSHPLSHFDLFLNVTVQTSQDNPHRFGFLSGQWHQLHTDRSVANKGPTDKNNLLIGTLVGPYELNFVMQ
jgi:hypothetical protein